MAKKFDLAALMGEAVSKSDTGEMRVEQIPLAEIEENENNSYAQTGIDELAESIKVIGLQQPLVVRRKTEGGYLLLAGHRRRNALALLDRKTVPCIGCRSPLRSTAVRTALPPTHNSTASECDFSTPPRLFYFIPGWKIQFLRRYSRPR